MEGGGFQDKLRARNEPECREAEKELYGKLFWEIVA